MSTRVEFRLRLWVALAVVTTALVLTAPAARAVTILIGAGQCDNGSAACVATQGNTVATAYDIKDLTPGAGANWTNFQSAFNSWNASLAAANQWTLATADPSAEAIFNVTIYRAYVNEGCGPTCGGAEIEVKWQNGGAAPNPIANANSIQANEAIWSQSISTNQKRVPSLPGNPYLDNAPGTPGAQLGPPAYPFQYDGSDFYDKPSRDAYAWWLADLWLSTADYTARVLTVYDGIEWGFTVETPLPAAWTMMLIALSGFGVVAGYRRRKQKPGTPLTA